MFNLPKPHGDKLLALVNNEKLPYSDKLRVEEAIERYTKWLEVLTDISGDLTVVPEMVSHLTDYKRYIDVDLIFDSDHNFLYRQKGQLKLDNSIIEEFIPILVTTVFADSLKDKELSFHNRNFSESASTESNIAYVAAECKTNLDKTMFQESSATALDVKSSVPGAKYFLICEWLDMSPISSSLTAIDEILILRKAKRFPSHLRSAFSTAKGRKENRDRFVKYLYENPFSPEVFMRFLGEIKRMVGQDEIDEKDVLSRGYF